MNSDPKPGDPGYDNIPKEPPPGWNDEVPDPRFTYEEVNENDRKKRDEAIIEKMAKEYKPKF